MAKNRFAFLRTKKYLGIDVGYNSVKLALVRGGQVLKTASVPMPVNLLREGRITSVEAMGELLQNAVKAHKLNASLAAVVLSGENSYMRTTTVPRMTAEQMAINLPYEFSDYITDELKNYTFDFAVVDREEAPADAEAGAENPEDQEEAERLANTMDVLAAAAPTEVLDEYRAVLRKAGMKMAKAAPPECAFINLIRSYQARTGCPRDQEFCVLELGFWSIRMCMFKGDRHVVTRILEIGLSALDDVLAEAMNVDVHLAHTYLKTNYENCQESEMERNTFDNMAVELMRALNFYRFSNPDSHLNDVWLCGGGANIPALRQSIEDTLGMKIHPSSELVPGGEALDNCHDYIPAIGVSLD